MTDRSKFEQMLEYLISEERDKAKEIFHQLVVEKSREIYENILSEELSEEEVEEGMQVTFSETEDEEDAMTGMDAMGGEDDGEVGGDATDDFMGDIDADGGDEMDMDGGEGEGDIEDRVMDLEDALDDLRAEFEQMMGDEAGEEEHNDGENDPDFGGEEGGEEEGEEEAGEEEGEEEEEEEVKDSFDATSFMREYIEKVTGGHGAEKKSTGDNGDNVKSVIDNMKNDMGGTTANIVKGGEASGKGVESGLLKPKTTLQDGGNINVPGGNAGKTAFKKREPGHGAERKGSGDNGDKSAGSPINGAPKRAK